MMTDSQIYTRAAKLIFRGDDPDSEGVMYSCCALDLVVGPWNSNRLIDQMAAVFAPRGLDGFHAWFTDKDGTPQQCRQYRVWMLLFCAAMAEAGDL
jgi:hypothetical protein